MIRWAQRTFVECKRYKTAHTKNSLNSTNHSLKISYKIASTEKIRWAQRKNTGAPLGHKIVVPLSHDPLAWSHKLLVENKINTTAANTRIHDALSRQSTNYLCSFSTLPWLVNLQRTRKHPRIPMEMSDAHRRCNGCPSSTCHKDHSCVGRD